MSKNVVLIQGGLGNQMFQYAYYLNILKEVNAYCDKSLYKINPQHNNCEIDRIFKISGIKETFAAIILRLFYNRLVSNRMRKFMFHIFGINYLLEDKQFNRNYKGLTIHEGYWQNYQYVENVREDIFKSFVFDSSRLSPKTMEICKLIERVDSVSIHIRGGDYLLPSFSSIYGGICTIGYYNEAISIIKKKVDKPVFFVFTDTDEMVAQIIHLEDNFHIVNFNKGEFSWQDMYMMSLCKHNIIANSSFSWWGAWLNTNMNKTVIAPSRFNNIDYTNNLLCPGWIAVENSPK